MASCQGCNMLEKTKYWHEFRPTKHKFHKTLSGDFEHHLTIPRKFIECFGGKLSSSCTLKGPSGNVWSIKIRRKIDDTLFSEGWEKFVRDHGLKDTYLLVFSYTGVSSFDVSIFDKSGCEVEASYFAQKMNSSSCMACRSILHNSSRGKRPLVSDVDQDPSFDLSEDEEEEPHLCTESSSTRRTSQARQYHVKYVSNRRAVTQEEKDLAKILADGYMFRNEYTNNVPMVAIKMLRSHVYSGFHLTIPKEWALKHMIRNNHNVELRVHGTKQIRWVVGCRWNQSKQCQLLSQWYKFAFDNNLEEDDVCVFELAEKTAPGGRQTPLFLVHIFRVVDKTAPLTVKQRFPVL